MIELTLTRDGVQVFQGNCDGMVEVGRQDRREPFDGPQLFKKPGGITKLIVADIAETGIGRILIRIEPLRTGMLRIQNVHERSIVPFQLNRLLSPQESVEVSSPVCIQLPLNYELTASVPDQALSESTSKPSEWDSALSAVGASYARPNRESLSDLGMTLTQMSMGQRTENQVGEPPILHWLELAVSAMQQPASSPDFFAGIAKAVANIIDVDRAEIILWDEQGWRFDPAGRFVNPSVEESTVGEPSNSILNRVLETKKIVVHPDHVSGGDLGLGDSVRVLNTAVACPILDMDSVDRQLLGVLYADRAIVDHHRPTSVIDAEKQLIAILATAIASSLARTRREKLVTKYQQFFSDKVIAEIKNNPNLLQGEDVEVTVLFCDIRGFSRTTEVIGASAAMTWMNETLSELSACVLKYDGVLVDYVGDELFAMWGAPNKGPDHAQRAVAAALEMMRLPESLSERYRDRIPEGIRFEIGLSTGMARVGNTGSKQKYKYGPMGTTVNLGKRIQGLAKQWKVHTLMDGETASRLPSEILRRRLCKASVVGLTTEVDLYELVTDESRKPKELLEGYETALSLYESGTKFRESARTFGQLIQQYPDDDPSLIMLVRAVKELVDKSDGFSPIWSASSK